MKHTPVFFIEAVEALKIVTGGKYIDGTYGLGGHSKLIAERGGMVLALDWDVNQIAQAQQNISKNIKIIHGNFADLTNLAKIHNFTPADGVLLDLGLAINQLENLQRGLSFKKLDEDLDMRLDNSLDLTAAEILNKYTETDLYKIFVEGSEELHAKAIAIKIVAERKKHQFYKVKDLVKILENYGNRTLTRIFQSLRIAVNHEYQNLIEAIKGAKEILNTSGRLVIITFHSLEDRLVKKTALEFGFETVKVKIPKNARHKFERSANLRIFTKT